MVDGLGVVSSSGSGGGCDGCDGSCCGGRGVIVAGVAAKLMGAMSCCC